MHPPQRKMHHNQQYTKQTHQVCWYCWSTIVDVNITAGLSTRIHISTSALINMQERVHHKERALQSLQTCAPMKTMQGAQAAASAKSRLSLASDSPGKAAGQTQRVSSILAAARDHKTAVSMKIHALI